MEDRLPAIGEELGLTIVARRTREVERAQPVIPYQIEVVAMDHPGIVHNLANFLASRGINIEDVNTST